MQCSTYDKEGKIVPKTAYQSRAEARVELKRLSKKGKRFKFFWKIYKCKVCGKFHLGKQNYKLILMMNEAQPIPLTDLRINNLVFNKYFPEEIFKVASVHPLRSCYLKDSKGGELCTEGEYIYGIPLTEEWFIRFGFELTNIRTPQFKEYETEQRWRIRHNEKEGYAYISIDNDCCFNDQEISKPLIYVSDLQNIYYFLTGTELTIK